MKRREKEDYLYEYSLSKNKGKSFFPYAIMKDSIMACVVLFVIIAMAILLGAELGPKADPTTTSFLPRPEWYFFFLFELLRVIKPPDLVVMASVGIPTICLVLLILLPFIDRSPERNPLKRPVAMLAGFTTVAAMAYLTLVGALAGSPNDIELEVKPQYDAGKMVAGQSGCLACHKIAENGNSGPGPDLTQIGSRLPAKAIARTLVNPTSPMPSYSTLQKTQPEKFNDLVNFLGSLR